MRLKLYLYLSVGIELIRGFISFLFLKLLGVSVRVKGGLRVSSGTGFKVYSKNAKLYFGKKNYIRKNCSIIVGESGMLKIGDRFFMNNCSSINCLSNIEIGEDCLFGEGVKLYDHNYDYRSKELVPLNKRGHVKGNIIIGNNCWLGSNTIILMNVQVGNNVIIGANNIIYKDIPDDTVVLAKQYPVLRSILR